jgi:hypothetical protein
MPSNEIHVDDIGTVFRATVVDEDSAIVDISASITKTMIFGKPDGSTFNRAGTFTTDGTDGKMQYATVDGDLDTHGNWTLQVFVSFGSTSWYSNITKFKVYKNLGCN